MFVKNDYAVTWTGIRRLTIKDTVATPYGMAQLHRLNQHRRREEVKMRALSVAFESVVNAAG
jgi:hypothetical protein